MRTNKKIFLVGFCMALFAGGILVEFGATSLDCSAAESVKAAAKSALDAVKQKAEAIKVKLQALSKAALASVKQVAIQINKKTYNDRYITLSVPFLIAERRYSFGFEYDFGFAGGGDLEKGFSPLVAMFWPPIVIDGVALGLTGDQFITMARSLNRSLESITKQIPVFPTKAVVAGVNKSLDGLQRITRFAPETVFFLKFYLLARSVGKTVKVKNVPMEVTTLLMRLAQSVNEPATIAANGGAKNSNAWKTKIYFKDTGIEDIFNKIPTFLRAPIDKMKKPVVSQGVLQEWQDRKAQKTPTAMQLAYSNMRRIPDYNDKSLYALEELIPLLDQGLNYADKELFVKALRVHWARRFDGMMSILKMKIDSVPGSNEVHVKELEQAVETIESVNEELATVKSVIMDRFPGLTQVLDEALKKMQAKGFSSAHTSLVAYLLAKVRADEQKIIPFTKQIDAVEDATNYDFADLNMEDFSALDPLQPTALESLDLSGAQDLASPI